jgi:hypothetical protein
LSQIHLHLSNNILQEVLKEKTIAALWLKLEQLCMTKDLTSKMHLKQKLFLHKLHDGGKVLDHLSEFKEIVADLESMEVKYEEENLGLILLCSLPSSYSNFRDTILYSRDTLTLNEEYEALQAKEKMEQTVSPESSNSQAEGLFVRGRQMEREDPLVDLEVRVQMAIGVVHSLEAKAKSSANIPRKPLILYLSVIS